MAGIKRSLDETKGEKITGTDSPYLPIFQTFRTELDEHHDRRERVIKASRDVTALSKKIIFALQRAKDLGQSLEGLILKQIEPMQTTVREILQNISVDLRGLNAHKYQRNISSGIQEWMEAVLFQHYLETQKIMHYEEATRYLPENVLLTYEDYVLGMFDMTGELMRFDITYMATRSGVSNSGRPDVPHTVLADMQQLGCQLELLDVSGSFGLSKDFEKKLKTTKTSVEKVENSVYNFIVRGSERPKGWRPDVTTLDGGKEDEKGESY